MTLILGLALGSGLVLCLSPLLWPMSLVGRRRSGRWPAAKLRERLAQAGLGWISIPGLVVVSFLVGAVVAAVTFAFVPVVAIALMAGMSGFALPGSIVAWRARLRRHAARVLWPDVVDHLVSAVRSGLALPDSVVTIAHSGPTPTRAAFAEFEREYRATGDFGLCVDGLKTRLADPVADRILETLRMSRAVGGRELTTVLRNLATYLRQEAAIRSEVEARQSWVMNAAKLGVAAPWVILLLLGTRPEAAAAYNSSAGVALIVVGLLVSVAAYRIMLGLGRMPEERRWFG